MTPEEKYQKKYWRVLQNIKDQELLSDDGKTVNYKIYHKVISVGHGEPSEEEEIIILNKLNKIGGIKIKKDENDDYEDISVFYLDILQPKFNELYNKYKKMNQDKSEIQKETEAFTGIKDSIIKNNKIFGGGSLISIQNTTNKNKDKLKLDGLEKITNNQTFATIFGALFVLVVIFLIYKYFGVNLTTLK